MSIASLVFLAVLLTLVVVGIVFNWPVIVVAGFGSGVVKVMLKVLDLNKPKPGRPAS